MGPQKPSAPAPPPDDLGIGGPFAPPPSPLVLPPSGIPSKKAATAAAQSRLRALKAQRKADALKLKAHNDAVFAARQDANVKRAIQQRVSATAGLTDTSSPFGPVQHGQGTGAKRFTDDLTTNSKLARARLERLTQGGLLEPTPPGQHTRQPDHPHGQTQSSREDAAIAALGSSRDLTFSDDPRHRLPWSVVRPHVDLTPDEDSQTLRAGFGGTRVTGHVDPTKPGFFASQMGPGYYGQGTDLSVFTPVGIQGGIERALGGLRPDTGQVPHDIVMPLLWLKEIFKTQKAAADTFNQKLTLHEFLTDKQKYGSYALGPKAREGLTSLMVQNGWNAKDAPTLTDQELAARAFNKFHKTLSGELRNFAAGASVLTSLPSAVQQVGGTAIEDVRERSAYPTLHYVQQFLQGWANKLPELADRPYDQVAYNDPVGATAAILPPAKLASFGAGRFLRLKPTRDITLPSVKRAAEDAKEKGIPMPDGFSHVRNVSASQHPIYRGMQAFSDAILARGKTPEELASRPPIREGLGGVPASLGRVASDVVAKHGNRIERGIIRRTEKDARAQASLDTGQEAHVALVNYATALRKFPWLGRHLGTDGQGKMEATASVVLHGLIGKSSEQIAEYFHGQAEHSEALAREWDGRAASAELDAHLAREEGSVQGNFKADEHAAEQARWEREAAEARSDAVKQRAMAEWSRANPHDHLNPQEGEQLLLDTARKVSHLQDELRKKNGDVNEKGVLYGRLQHNLTVTYATEGPGSKIAIAQGHGETGTPLWREANRLIHPQKGLRFLHNQARDALYGRPPGSEESDPLPTSADLRTPEAQHQLGRYNRLGLLQRVGDAISRQREHRRAGIAERAVANAAGGEGADALGVARNHMAAWGIDSSLLDTARHRASGALAALVHGGDEKAMRAEERAQQQRGSEAAGHSAGIARQLRVAYHDLQVMKDRNQPINEISQQEHLIQELHQQAEDTFKPSEAVLGDESLAEKTRLVHGLRQLPESEITRIINEVFTPEQIHQIGPQVLHDAVHEEVLNGNHLDRTNEEIRQRLNHASTAYTDETQLDPELAATFQRDSQHYLQRLRAYNGLLADQGIVTGHLHLHRPDDPEGLPPVMVTSGKQFRTANFTHDVHIYLAKDLEGLSAKAVQGRIYELLADSPFVIEHAAEGEAPPAGYVAVSASDWKNMKSPNPDGEQLGKLLRQWQSGRDEAVEGPQTWISRGQRQLILDLAAHYGGDGRVGAGISGLLAATNWYRRWMLYSLPRTFVNNATGNPLIAMVMGSRLRDMREAIWTLRNHPERIPGTMRGRGPISQAGQQGGIPLFGWRSMWRHLNTFSEDNGNLMVYLLHQRKAYKIENNLKWFNRVRKTDELWAQYLIDAANGKKPSAFEAGKKAAQAFGDMHDHWKHDPGLSSTFLFHRWVLHTIYLTLWSLPIHYPGRFLFLQQASELAEQYHKEHGFWPEWTKGLLEIPGMDRIEHLPLGMQRVLWAVSTGGVNAFATPGQTLDMGNTAQPKFPGQSLIAANISPYIRVPAEVFSGRRLDTGQPFMNRFGDPIGPGFNWREGVNNVVANTPIANTIWSRAGMSDDSIQILPGLLGQAYPRYSSNAKYDPAMGPPSAFGHGFLKDLALSGLSAAGLTIRPVDAEGVRSTYAANASRNYQAIQASKRQAHQAQAVVRMLHGLTVPQRIEWFRKNDPEGYKHQIWRYIK